MINDLNVIFGKNNLELVIQIVKTIIIALCTYYTNFKIVNKKFELNFLGLVGIFIVTFLAILSTHLRLKINFLVANVFLVIFISMIFSLYKVKNSVTVTVMSIVINYSIFIFSIIIDFVINKIVFIDNDCIDLIIILMVYFIVLARFNKIMALQKQIAKIKLEEKIGNEYETIIDGETEDEKYYIGRSYMDIPNEDGVIFIEKNKKDMIGKFVKVKITGVFEYDYIGEMIE